MPVASGSIRSARVSLFSKPGRMQRPLKLPGETSTLPVSQWRTGSGGCRHRQSKPSGSGRTTHDRSMPSLITTRLATQALDLVLPILLTGGCQHYLTVSRRRPRQKTASHHDQSRPRQNQQGPILTLSLRLNDPLWSVRQLRNLFLHHAMLVRGREFLGLGCVFQELKEVSPTMQV
jgi:hypothetical protein